MPQQLLSLKLPMVNRFLQKEFTLFTPCMLLSIYEARSKWMCFVAQRRWGHGTDGMDRIQLIELVEQSGSYIALKVSFQCNVQYNYDIVSILEGKQREELSITFEFTTH